MISQAIRHAIKRGAQFYGRWLDIILHQPYQLVVRIRLQKTLSIQSLETEVYVDVLRSAARPEVSTSATAFYRGNVFMPVRLFVCDQKNSKVAVDFRGIWRIGRVSK